MTDINEIIGRAMWEQRRRFAAEQVPDPPLEEWGDGSIPAANGVQGEVAAVVKALGEAGYSIGHVKDRASLLKRITDWEEMLGSIEPMDDQRLVLSKALLRQAAEELEL